MNKRGRPNVYERMGFSDVREFTLANSAVRTNRGLANQLYQQEGLSVIKEAASEIPYCELLYVEGTIHTELKDIPQGLKFKRGIAEQIGRMSFQDGFCKEDCIAVAKIAAEALHNGYTVKEIEKYIRKGRMTGEW